MKAHVKYVIDSDIEKGGVISRLLCGAIPQVPSWRSPQKTRKVDIVDVMSPYIPP